MWRSGLLALVTVLACSRGAPRSLPVPVSEASIRVTDISKNPDFPLYYAEISLPEPAWVTLIGIRPSGEMFGVGRRQYQNRPFPAGTRRVRLGIGSSPRFGPESYSAWCGDGIMIAHPPIAVHLTPDQAAALGNGVSNSSGVDRVCSQFSWHQGILLPSKLSKLVMLLTPRPIRWALEDQAGVWIDGRTTGMDAARSLALRYDAVLIEESPRP